MCSTCTVTITVPILYRNFAVVRQRPSVCHLRSNEVPRTTLQQQVCPDVIAQLKRQQSSYRAVGIDYIIGIAGNYNLRFSGGKFLLRDIIHGCAHVARPQVYARDSLAVHYIATGEELIKQLHTVTTM